MCLSSLSFEKNQRFSIHSVSGNTETQSPGHSDSTNCFQLFSKHFGLEETENTFSVLSFPFNPMCLFVGNFIHMFMIHF